MKTCTECGIEKDDGYFYSNKSKCKECILKQQKLYKSRNKDNISKRNKQYYTDHKDDILIQQKQYIADNKDNRMIYNQQWYIEIKEYKKEYHKQWYIENKISIIKKGTQYKTNRRVNDPIFKLRANVSTAIYTALHKIGLSKNGNSILKYLPYSIKELKDHLERLFEPWMNWDNWGPYDSKRWDDNDPTTWTWNIDHIVPHSTFNYTSMEDQSFRDCWALSNLRPLSAKQNIEDGNRR